MFLCRLGVNSTKIITRGVYMKDKVLKRFFRYIKINTQSNDDAGSFPSTENQFDLARLLVDELKELGLEDAGVDDHCIVMATLPASVDGYAPKIGLIAHMDTSPEVSGAHVRPQTIERYGGGDIVINKDLNIVIKESETPNLKNCMGHTLITTDGTTLLGADDKAGVAAIMTTLEILKENPMPHTEIKIAFTPDEEIGHGVDFFDVEKFGADFAYTVDGGVAGELNRETFSANEAIVSVEGRNIHPGTAKDIMVNAIRVMGHIISRLPKDMTPETTEGYAPFIHPMTVEGGVARTRMKMILRDFETGGLDTQKEILEKIIDDVQTCYPKAKINLEITETYRNMGGELEKHPHVTDRLWTAVEGTGLTPKWVPIRGGTDGSRLTAMGLPTPNIFAGGSNFHSKTEWLCVEGLVKSVETLLNIVKVED
jgi:tripeptide aminopeptidase